MRSHHIVIPSLLGQLAHSAILSVKFPISNVVCPVLPATNPSSRCGPFTHNVCDTPTASCAVCKPKDGGSLSLTESTDHIYPLKDDVVGVEDYAFYHMLHMEYLVAFSKNPMPFQPKLDLPFCGLPTFKPVIKVEGRDAAEDDESSEAHFNHEKRGWFKDALKGDVKIGGTLGQVGEGLKHLGGEIQKGLAPLGAPIADALGLEKAPKYLPRPVCIPQVIQVPVHFTVFTSNITTSAFVTPEVLMKQIELTNKAFEPLGIHFFIATVSSHIGQEWEKFTHNRFYSTEPGYEKYQERIKAENRYGGNDEVNIWIVEEIDKMNCETSVSTSGYCTFASNLQQKGHPVDGCVMTIGTLPGVNWRASSPGRGTTLTHELGHWFNLQHIFPENGEAGCKGESDGVSDTFQFPNNADKFKAEQQRCCATGEGRNKKWSLCEDTTTFNVTNYMSYSKISGEIIPGNDPGTMPWTTEQRARMFAAYFTLRRKAPLGGITCNDYPVFFDESSPSKARAYTFGKRADLRSMVLRGPNLLSQSSRLLAQLKKICAKKPDLTKPPTIDIISGEELECDINANCKPPVSGVSCPDGSDAPCKLDAVCIDGTAPPCDAVVMCPNGSAPPCPLQGGDTCPDGAAPTCSGRDGKTPDGKTPDGKTPDGKTPDGKTPDGKTPDGKTPDGKTPDGKTPDGKTPDGKTPDGKTPDGKTPDGKTPDGKTPDGKTPDGKTPDGKTPDGKTPDGKTPDGKTPDGKTPDGKAPDLKGCPAGCDVFTNKCDKTTAPTCIYPDPRVPKPRAACACRPGYKATSASDTDTTKHWRLPIVGQEHRVWVAEGVPCDKLCTVSTGVNSCREVSQVAVQCASLP